MVCVANARIPSTLTVNVPGPIRSSSGTVKLIVSPVIVIAAASIAQPADGLTFASV